MRLSVLFTLPVLALACAKPATVVDPEQQRAVVQADAELERAAARARTERLTAWVADNLDGERYQVPIAPDDLSFGAGADARVTFVVFLDYQCPYCARLDKELHALVETYPTDVRIVVKQFPLAMHERAALAAQFLLAAHAQGRGQAMHELLFANADRLDDATLVSIVREAQLPDPDRLRTDLEQGTFAARVERDLELGRRLAVSSTPTFFVNGVPQRGAKSFDQLRELYIAQLEVAERVVAAGAAREEVYGLLMANAKPDREPPPRPPSAPSGPRPGKPDPAVSYAVPVDGRPTRGNVDAPVTIIEFADFECPYSRKVEATLAELERRYGADIRIVYRHQPLPTHAAAKPAAMAAAAADRQGEFWPMHDALFAAGKDQLGELGFHDTVAAQLGLDVDRFRADLRDPKLAELIEADQKVAAQFGVTGTPSFFVNGRYLGGAQPIEAFAALIDEELGKANAYANKHEVTPSQLYASMAKGWATEVEQPPLADHTRRKIDVTDLPGKGKLRKPKITMVMCGDFDCPYTAKGAQIVDELLVSDAYKDKVAFYFMHFPLPMHEDALGAHKAAIAAGKQGKFWEMHDLLFADRERRTQADFADMAASLGLDVGQFLSDWASSDTSDAIDETMATCRELGVTGTPNFFVNGRLVKGALPFDLMSEVFDEELAGGFEAKEKNKNKKSAK